MTRQVEADEAAALARLHAGETLAGADVTRLLGRGADDFTDRALGLAWDTVSLERVTAHLDADERHHQPFGIVHGGVWCAVVESVASVAGLVQVAAAGQVVVGVNNTTDFVRPHRSGRVEVVATPIHVGRTQQLWQVTITRASDAALVAQGQLRLHNLDPARVGVS